MKITLKHYADYFAIALEIGLPIKEEMITWADNLILNALDSSILEWEIDLATSKNKTIQDTISLLKEIVDEQDLNIFFRLVLAKISILYPNANNINYSVMCRLSNWYRLEQLVSSVNVSLTFDLYNFEFICYQSESVWKSFINESDIPKYYQELIAIGKDYIPYLPI